VAIWSLWGITRTQMCARKTISSLSRELDILLAKSYAHPFGLGHLCTGVKIVVANYNKMLAY
jgi:hypothetical protein